MAKDRQKWVQIFLGMSYMLDNNICNSFLFLNFILLVDPVFRVDFFKTAIKKQDLGFDVLGFMQHLYDTKCLQGNFWVKLVRGLG